MREEIGTCPVLGGAGTDGRKRGPQNRKRAPKPGQTKRNVEKKKRKPSTTKKQKYSYPTHARTHARTNERRCRRCRLENRLVKAGASGVGEHASKAPGRKRCFQV